MAKYVDGFVLSIKKDKVDAYKKMAKEACTIWMKNGALDYKECLMEDATPQNVTFTFPKMAKTKEDEVTVFAYIVFKSRKHRDQVNTKVMAHFDEKYKDKKSMDDMPFDMKKMAYGGFEVLVSA